MADLSNFEQVIRDWLQAIEEVVQTLKDLEMQIEELENEVFRIIVEEMEKENE